MVAAAGGGRQTRCRSSFLGAFRAGLRYTRASRELHVVLLRAAVFFAFASSVWALLPLVARQMLGGGAGFYGMLLGAVGAGAIGGALLMPRLRARLDAGWHAAAGRAARRRRDGRPGLRAAAMGWRWLLLLVLGAGLDRAR